MALASSTTFWRKPTFARYSLIKSFDGALENDFVKRLLLHEMRMRCAISVMMMVVLFPHNYSLGMGFQAVNHLG